MAQNEEKIVSRVDPMFTYIEHDGGYVLNVPKNDDIVVLAMRKTDWETLVCTYNDKMITNSKTRKGAKEGKVPNPSLNGFNFIINNNQSAKMMQNAESVKKLYVSQEEYWTRITTPSTRNKGNISPPQPGKLAVVQPPNLLANLNPVPGHQNGTNLLLPAGGMLPYYSPSDSSES